MMMVLPVEATKKVDATMTEFCLPVVELMFEMLLMLLSKLNVQVMLMLITAVQLSVNELSWHCGLGDFKIWYL